MHFEVAFNPSLERDGAGRAADASAMKTDSDNALRRDIDEFNITAVRLHSGADEVDHFGDAIAKFGAVARTGLNICGHAQS